MNRRIVSVLSAVAMVAAAYSVWGPGRAPDREAPIAAVPAPNTIKAPETDTRTRSNSQRQAAAGQSSVRGCSIVSHYLPIEDGTATEVFSCEPHEPQEVHPYASYPTAALESLAYADARAAGLLSRRLRESDSEAAMSLALRAAALSGGDPTPIVAYGNAYPEPAAIDGVPVRKTVHVKYVLSAVTRLLGDPRHSAPYFEAIIRAHSADPDREIAMLDARAQQMIEEMRQVQLDVTGSSTIGG